MWLATYAGGPAAATCIIRSTKEAPMGNSMNDASAALGRVLLSVIFLLSGFQKLAGFGGTVGYMGSAGLPFPELAAVVAILVECVGGILLVIGYQTRLVGLVLALWCVATALVAHTQFADQNQMVHFLKNIAMAGGFLQLVAFGAGAWSLDARRRTRAPGQP
jgi:putative oxidoreductase